MPYPKGTRVVVKSVDHLGRFKRPRHLIGRTGTVIDHENGMNIVGGLTLTGNLVGRVFGDNHLTAS